MPFFQSRKISCMKDLKYLNKYFIKYKKRLSAGILFVIISNIFAVFPAQVIRHAFDLVKENLNLYQLFDGFSLQTIFYSHLSHTLLLFGLIVLSMALLKGLFMFFMRQTLIVMSRLIEYDLKNEIYAHYQRLPLAFYRRNNTGDLMARISEDVSRVRMYTGPAIMYFLNLLILFILVIGSMLSVNVKLTLYVLAPLPFLSFSIYYVNNIINRQSEKVQEKLSAISTFVQEAFSGIRVIKTFARETSTGKRFEKESADYKDASVRLAKVNAFFAPAMLLLIGLSTLITVYVGGREVIAGKATVGNIAEFIIYINMLTWPVASVGWVTSIIQRADASQRRINEFLKTEPDIVSGQERIKELTGKIEFRDVSFTYPDTGINALKNITFTAEPGGSIAILGKTGSGKSTAASLITRMYDCSDGNVNIDNRDIRSYNLGDLREQIGYVPQDVFLFSDTIYNNIAFGLAPADTVEDTILRAAKDAAIYSNIMEFPDGFETRIGERGITLSGGQKQRISIARAIAKEPRILIFDDCLSAVDTQTEEEILSRLKEIMKDKTTILISHRVSSVKMAKKIIVLENGSIVEEGDHDTLILKKGLYFQMYEQQLTEREIDTI